MPEPLRGMKRKGNAQRQRLKVSGRSSIPRRLAAADADVSGRSQANAPGPIRPVSPLLAPSQEFSTIWSNCA
jgi:hypothetical protein